jgi:dolichyl-phosphate beta-glucosyltransferase
LTKPFLSIIIPAYNEEKRLPVTLGKAAEFVASQAYLTEVIVVENGSQDRTWEIARQFEEHHANFYALREEKRGKGNAVKKGMLEARGDFRFMCDADLSMPIEEISRFIPPELNDFDIAIGSREATGAVRFDEPFHRHWGGRLINFLIRLLVLPGMHDTQCGFKCFRDSAAEALFPRQTLNGWSFDIEVLYMARMAGLKIVEIPIPWYFNPDSKVNPGVDAIKMAVDILKIRWNAIRGAYRLSNMR